MKHLTLIAVITTLSVLDGILMSIMPESRTGIIWGHIATAFSLVIVFSVKSFAIKQAAKIHMEEFQ
jgi:hypothetical protein